MLAKLLNHIKQQWLKSLNHTKYHFIYNHIPPQQILLYVITQFTTILYSQKQKAVRKYSPDDSFKLSFSNF